MSEQREGWAVWIGASMLHWVGERGHTLCGRDLRRKFGGVGPDGEEYKHARKCTICAKRRHMLKMQAQQNGAKGG
jgi:hypothetical protein